MLVSLLLTQRKGSKVFIFGFEDVLGSCEQISLRETNCSNSMVNALEWCGDIFMTLSNIWVKVFKNGPSEICGRQPLKKFT